MVIYFVMILFSNIGVYSIMVIHILTIPVKELHNDILNIEQIFLIKFKFTTENVSKYNKSHQQRPFPLIIRLQLLHFGNDLQQNHLNVFDSLLQY